MVGGFAMAAKPQKGNASRPRRLRKRDVLFVRDPRKHAKIAPRPLLRVLKLKPSTSRTLRHGLRGRSVEYEIHEPYCRRSRRGIKGRPPIFSPAARCRRAEVQKYAGDASAKAASCRPWAGMRGHTGTGGARWARARIDGLVWPHGRAGACGHANIPCAPLYLSGRSSDDDARWRHRPTARQTPRARTPSGPAGPSRRPSSSTCPADASP